jgi:hypothetical protein
VPTTVFLGFGRNANPYRRLAAGPSFFLTALPPGRRITLTKGVAGGGQWTTDLM